MLTGALASAAAYDAPVAGFNCLERAADEGYEAFAISYEGHGTSSFPGDGTSVGPERMLQDAADAVEWIRATAHVDRVDLFGSSVGSLVAMKLGSVDAPIPPGDVGGIVLTGVIYDEPTETGLPAFAMAAAPPAATCGESGYILTSADDYAPLLATADPAVAAWARAALPGEYALGPLLSLSHLPVFDPGAARAPALQIWGDHDPLTPASDVALFQARYGGPIGLYVVEGGGHVPYYEPGAGDVWQVAFGFLETVHASDGARCADGFRATRADAPDPGE